MKQKLKSTKLPPIQARVLRLREKGETYAQIAEKIGLTSERIRQIEVMARETLKMASLRGEKAEWAKLPDRLATRLRRLGYKTKEQVRRAVDRGDFLLPDRSGGVKHRGERVRGMGWICWVNLLQWLNPDERLTSHRILQAREEARLRTFRPPALKLKVWAGLPIRAAKRLESEGFKSKSEIRRALARGELVFSDATHRLYHRGVWVTGFGPTTWAALLRWLDEPAGRSS
jgi:hypothetical protein